MRCLTIDPLKDARWTALIQAQPSSIFHSPGWIRVLKDTYNFDIKANILVPSGGVNADECSANEMCLSDKDPMGEALSHSPIGGLPFCRLDDIRGNRVAALPFCDFTDPLVESIEQWEQLVNPILASNLPFKIRPLHNTVPLMDTRFEKSNRARWHGLDLRPPIDELWTQLKGAARTAVRKAQKHDVLVKIATEESELKAFYNLHVGVRKNKYRMVAQPYHFFRNIWQELIVNGQGQILTASHENKIIAATIFLHWKNTIYYKFNASDPAMLWLNPNELLLWEGIKYGKECGCQLMDFGLSDWDQEGLIFYKRKFSNQEKTIHFLNHVPTPAVKAHAAEKKTADVGALLPRLTDLFTDESVPEQIAQKAGELLYQYFA